MQISNVSAMEVNLVRPFVRRALEAFYKHDKPEADVDRDTRSSRQQREANNNEPRVRLFTYFLPFFNKKIIKERYKPQRMFYRDL